MPDLVEAVLAMYRKGAFPMDDEGVTAWWQAGRRCLIPLDERFRVSRSLRSRVRSEKFRVTTDEAFDRVIEACAASRPRAEGTWINDEIRTIFSMLHRAGHAHSIEAWLPGARGPELVGGLYGLALGGVFCGESMFSRADHGGTDASKTCLVHLVHHLRRREFGVLDAQLQNPHLDQFGAYSIGHAEYLRLARTHSAERAWLPFEPERTIEELTLPRTRAAGS